MAKFSSGVSSVYTCVRTYDDHDRTERKYVRKIVLDKISSCPAAVPN